MTWPELLAGMGARPPSRDAADANDGRKMRDACPPKTPEILLLTLAHANIAHCGRDEDVYEPVA
eukprot:6721971-Alexandrium_andersonii.AAC.1